MRKDIPWTYIVVGLCFIGVSGIFAAHPTTVHLLCMVVGLLQLVNLSMNTEKVKAFMGQQKARMIQIAILLISLLILSKAIVIIWVS